MFQTRQKTSKTKTCRTFRTGKKEHVPSLKPIWHWQGSLSKRKIIFQSPIFRYDLWVSERVSYTKYLLPKKNTKHLLGCPRKFVSMVSKWVISPTYEWGFVGVITYNQLTSWVSKNTIQLHSCPRGSAWRVVFALQWPKNPQGPSHGRVSLNLFE